MESILITIRSMLDVDQDYDGFDTSIIAGINTAIFSLSQLGIGPDGGYSITGETETWSDLFDGVSNLDAVKSYIWLKTKMEFDPPTTSFLLESINRQLTQLEWRLMVEVDPDFVPEA
jgi:hypothetical protein